MVINKNSGVSYQNQYNLSFLALTDIPSNTSFMISLIGAGGKTTTAFKLAHYFKSCGYQVVITTTTKMYPPEKCQYDHLYLDSLLNNTKMIAKLNQSPHQPTVIYYANNYDPTQNKMVGVTSERLDQLKKQTYRTLFIVEADGAKQHMLKAPAWYEPCIPSQTDWVIAITDASMINTPADPEKIHRWLFFTQELKIKAGEILDIKFFSQFINRTNGMFKGTPKQAKTTWLINQHQHNNDNKKIAIFVRQLILLTPRLNTIWVANIQHFPHGEMNVIKNPLS